VTDDPQDQSHEHEQGHEHEHEHQHVPRSLEEELADFRASKDEFFRSSPGSPIPHERRHHFPGLNYFAASVDHRIEGLTLQPDPDPEATADISTSDEKSRTAWSLGHFEFDTPAGHGRLAAYVFGHVHDDEPVELFVPFRDATSGRETYGAGRYLDVTPEEDGSYTLDFNLAYNPWCAYAPQYSCPLPPPENWLPFPVEAGELVPPEPDDAEPTSTAGSV
jgi:uncharacterized protein